VIAGEVTGFRAQVAGMAERLVSSPAHPALLAAKARQLAAPAQHRPLADYRAAELAVMARNFFDPAEPYAELRRAFVYKDKPAHTPPHLARHQDRTPRRSELPRLAS
jgi:putative two-component system hydrogenase maturation factor HypX/HoxX